MWRVDERETLGQTTCCADQLVVARNLPARPGVYGAARQRTRGAAPGPAGPLCRPRPRRPGASPGLPAGRLRDAQVAPCPWPSVALVAPAAAAPHPASGGYAAQPDPPQHHDPAAPPRAAASPYDGVTFEDPGSTRSPTRTRTASRHSRWTSTPRPTGIAQRFVADGNLPDPAASGSRNGSTPSTTTTRPPSDGTFAVHVDGGPTPVPRPRTRCCSGSASRPATSSERARPDAALTFVIDTSGSMEREDRLELVKDSLRKLVLAWARATR